MGGTGGTFGGVGLVGSGAVFDVDPVSAVVGTFDSVLVELAIKLWGHGGCVICDVCDGLSFQVLIEGSAIDLHKGDQCDFNDI